MKVTIINKYDNKGGAAIAAFRLTEALVKKGINTKMLVEEKSSSSKNVVAIRNSKLSKLIGHYKFLMEKIWFIPKEINKTERFSFSTAILGNNILNNKNVQDADVIHLHWINHSYLSLKNIKKLNKLNKPIVITMHDMWYATGGCHYARECSNYTNECGMCMFLKTPSKNDISNKQFIQKSKLYNSNITFVGCSNWITQLAKKSNLLKNNLVLNIPNPINTSFYKNKDKDKSKLKLGLDTNKKYLLFVAASITNPRKGYKYLEEATHLLSREYKESIELLVLGNIKNDNLNFGLKTHKLGYISSEVKITEIYNAADIFISPSLEDNLPNTIMESMSCGTPCVAFNVGGIPELIDHKTNGYLSKYKDSTDLSTGIKWILANPQASIESRNKVQNTFSEEIITDQFIELYHSMI